MSRICSISELTQGGILSTTRGALGSPVNTSVVRCRGTSSVNEVELPGFDCETRMTFTQASKKRRNDREVPGCGQKMSIWASHGWHARSICSRSISVRGLVLGCAVRTSKTSVGLFALALGEAAPVGVSREGSLVARNSSTDRALVPVTSCTTISSNRSRKGCTQLLARARASTSTMNRMPSSTKCDKADSTPDRAGSSAAVGTVRERVISPGSTAS
mmetsp:Transcript_45045/g.78652  ORF Transcript_45045/g.78652 Transcript_45045/m.78652 type:complete len:217 (+) Transcript_45045:144-794(+)